MPIKTIVFDLGGVLIDWNPRYLYKNIFDSEEKMEWFLTRVCSPDWNAEQDGGRSFEAAIDELLPEYPEYKPQIEAYYSRWVEMLGGAIEGTVEILREFHQSERHEILALTNWSKQTFPIALDQFDFLHWFSGILVSGEENMKKPDLEIYELLIKRYGLTPSETLFIDDSHANIVSAKELDINTIHFRNPEQLRAEIDALT